MKTMRFEPIKYDGIDYDEMCESYKMMGLRKGGTYLVLGEIENMPGHLAVVNDYNKVVPGMHNENFIEDNGVVVETTEDDFE